MYFNESNNINFKTMLSLDLPSYNLKCHYKEIKIVETKLREKCLAAGSNEAQQKTGADWAVLAFNKQNGCLNPPWPIATEAHQGVQLMFQVFLCI